MLTDNILKTMADSINPSLPPPRLIDHDPMTWRVEMRWKPWDFEENLDLLWDGRCQSASPKFTDQYPATYAMLAKTVVFAPAIVWGHQHDVHGIAAYRDGGPSPYTPSLVPPKILMFFPVSSNPLDHRFTVPVSLHAGRPGRRNWFETISASDYSGFRGNFRGYSDRPRKSFPVISLGWPTRDQSDTELFFDCEKAAAAWSLTNGRG